MRVELLRDNLLKDFGGGGWWCPVCDATAENPPSVEVLGDAVRVEFTCAICGLREVTVLRPGGGS